MLTVKCCGNPLCRSLEALTIGDIIVDQLHHVSVHGTICSQNDRQLRLHAVWKSGSDKMLGVKACAAAAILRLVALETLVLDAAEVKMALQSADPAHLGAPFPCGLSSTPDAAEVTSLDMLWPSLLWVPQNYNTVGQVKGNPVPIRIVRGVWGQFETVEDCLAPLIGQQPLGLGLSPVVSRVVGFEDSTSQS